MAISSRDYVKIAEGVKSHELSTKGRIEHLKGKISELSGEKSVLNESISYLEASIEAAYENTDEYGDLDYDLISSLEAKKCSAESELLGVVRNIDNSRNELESSENELESVLEEKEQTLFEILERARTTSQNIASAGGMYGAYSGIGNNLQNSLKTSLASLSQAAGILGGSVDENSGAGTEKAYQRGDDYLHLNNIGQERKLAASALSAFESGNTVKSIATVYDTNNTNFVSRQMDVFTPTIISSFHLGQSKINTQKEENYYTEQTSNIYMASALGEKDSTLGLDTVDFNGINYQSLQESSGLEKCLREDLEKRRNWAKQYEFRVNKKSASSLSMTNNSGKVSKGQREKQIVDETEIEYDGIITNIGFGKAGIENVVKQAKNDMKHFRENEMLYSYYDMSKNPKLAFVDPNTIFGLRIGNKSTFWNYKKSESKERYIELAKEIDTVQLLHNIKQVSYEQIAKLGGTLGACAQYYFLDNAICVEKIGNAFIFRGDGRHRLQAAIEAGISKIPIKIVGEHCIKSSIAGIKQGKKMSFAEADTGHVNPKYGLDVGYSKNCQSCVVVFEARLRGYNVSVLPLEKDSVLDRLSRKCNWAWIDPKTGKEPEYIYDSKLKNPDEYFKFIQDTVVLGNRYTIQFLWKNRKNSGHIVNLDRTEDGKLRIKDNQRGSGERSEWVGNREVLEYLSRMNYFDDTPKILRIDNMNFNPDVINYIVEENVNG